MGRCSSSSRCRGARGRVAQHLQPRRALRRDLRPRDRAARRECRSRAAGRHAPEAEIEPHLYTRVERDALKHLFRVASSPRFARRGRAADPGAGQDDVRSGRARRHGGPRAQQLRAGRVARRKARVRSETEIARNPRVSISSVAVEFARNIYGDFHGKRVLVVGAGKMSDLAARALRAQGAALTVTNRTRARADELAAKVGADVHDFADLVGALGKADIVIASTGAQRPVLTRELMTRVQRARRGRTLFLIDIAVPRDVEPSVAELDGIYVADIDDLQKKAAVHLEGRQAETGQAEAIVEQEVARFMQSFSGRQLGEIVTALRTHVIGVAHGEGEEALAGFAHLRREGPQRDPGRLRRPRQEAPPSAADGAQEGRGRSAARSSMPSGSCSTCRPPSRCPRPRAPWPRARQQDDRPRGSFMSNPSNPGKIVIGTRGSALARWQAAHVARTLEAAHPGLVIEERILVTEGDRVQTGPVIDLGGKGVWVKEIEDALLAGTIDLAVHSLKDVPAALAPGLALVAILERADPRDALISRAGAGLASLPPGAVVGTSSLRRVCQVRAMRPDLRASRSCAATSTRACARSPRASSTPASCVRGPRSPWLRRAHHRALHDRADVARDRPRRARARGACRRCAGGFTRARARRPRRRAHRRRRTRAARRSRRRVPHARRWSAPC